MIELYRAIIPANKIINDNHGQHYRIHQGNLEFLTRQFNEIKSGSLSCTADGPKSTAPWNFKMPSLELVDEIFDLKNIKELENCISIRCEVWRCRNIRFDPQNYAKTFKAPLDLLVSNGYIKDDNWKYVDGITYCGGGMDAWVKRAFRYENDGLPNELTPDEWKKWSDDYNDILVRIIID